MLYHMANVPLNGDDEWGHECARQLRAEVHGFLSHMVRQQELN